MFAGCLGRIFMEMEKHPMTIQGFPVSAGSEFKKGHGISHPAGPIYCTSNSSGVTGSSSPLEGDIPFVAIWVTGWMGICHLDIPIWKLDILRLPFERDILISHFQTHLCWSNHAARLSDGIPSDGNHLKSSIENLYIPTHILYVHIYILYIYIYIYYTYIYIYIIHI